MTIAELIKTAFQICLLILAMPLLFIMKLFQRPTEKPYEEVESVLKEMLANNQEHNDWDYFLNVPIADAKLEQIRKRVEMIWNYDEFMYETESNGWLLNEKGISELRIIFFEFEALKHTTNNKQQTTNNKQQTTNNKQQH